MPLTNVSYNIIQIHPDHDFFLMLTDWEKHLKMQFLMYGAYFESFYPLGHKFEG